MKYKKKYHVGDDSMTSMTGSQKPALSTLRKQTLINLKNEGEDNTEESDEEGYNSEDTKRA